VVSGESRGQNEACGCAKDRLKLFYRRGWAFVRHLIETVGPTLLSGDAAHVEDLAAQAEDLAAQVEDTAAQECNTYRNGEVGHSPAFTEMMMSEFYNPKHNFFNKN